MSKALVVGLTGPMGSGKSAVADVFVKNGFKLIDADKIAREVVEKGSETLEKLAKAFGDDVINPDGTLNRKLISKKAFSSVDTTELLNSITHPAIVSLVKKRIAEFESSGYSKIIYDAPLLFESGTDKLCDKIVCVIAPKEQRTERVKLRDNMAYTDIESRMNAQHDDSFYTKKSDFVIINDSTKASLLNKTHAVLSEVCEVDDVTTF